MMTWVPASHSDCNHHKIAVIAATSKPVISATSKPVIAATSKSGIAATSKPVIAATSFFMHEGVSQRWGASFPSVLITHSYFFKIYTDICLILENIIYFLTHVSAYCCGFVYYMSLIIYRLRKCICSVNFLRAFGSHVQSLVDVDALGHLELAPWFACLHPLPKVVFQSFFN